MSACRVTALISAGKGRAPGPAAWTLPEKPVCCSAPRRYGAHILGTIPPNSCISGQCCSCGARREAERRGDDFLRQKTGKHFKAAQHLCVLRIKQRAADPRGRSREPWALPAAHFSPWDGEGAASQPCLSWSPTAQHISWARRLFPSCLQVGAVFHGLLLQFIT